MTADDCPGVGRCHGPVDWCASCNARKAGPCDVRARGERCDQHPPAAELERDLAALDVDAWAASEDARAADVEWRRARDAEAAARRKVDAREASARRLIAEAGELRSRLAAAKGDEHGEARTSPEDRP